MVGDSKTLRRSVLLLLAVLIAVLLLLIFQLIRRIEPPVWMQPDLSMSDAVRNPTTRPLPSEDIARSFGPDSYPPDALRAGQQGRVVTSLIVDERGHVRNCVTDQSSGVPSLDEATCAIARRLIFNPGLDNANRRVVTIYPLAVRWQLPDE